MHERHGGATGSGPGLRIDGGGTGCDHPSQGGDTIFYPVGHMVEALSATLEKPGDRRLRTRRGRELYVGLTDLDQGLFDTVGVDNLAMVDLRTERFAVVGDRRLQIVDCDGDVVDLDELHARNGICSLHQSSTKASTKSSWLWDTASMELRPEDLEKVNFKMVDDGGIDPAEVEKLLQRAAERIRTLEQEGVRAVGGTVAEMLDQAVKSSEELTAKASADAGSIHEAAEAAKAEAQSEREAAKADAEEAREAAEADAEEALTSAKADAEELVAGTKTQIELQMADAKSECESIIEEAAVVAAKQITDAELNAAEKIASAGTEAESLVRAAERNSIERSTRVINEAQQRLDRLLAAERDVHDRLQAAMSDIQTSVSRVGVDQGKELALTVEDPSPSLDEARWADDDPPDEVSARRRSA